MSKQFEVSVKTDHDFLYVTLHVAENVYTSAIKLEDLEKMANRLIAGIRNKKRAE